MASAPPAVQRGVTSLVGCEEARAAPWGRHAEVGCRGATAVWLGASRRRIPLTSLVPRRSKAEPKALCADTRLRAMRTVASLRGATGGQGLERHRLALWDEAQRPGRTG